MPGGTIKPISQYEMYEYHSDVWESNDANHSENYFCSYYDDDDDENVDWDDIYSEEEDWDAEPLEPEPVVEEDWDLEEAAKKESAEQTQTQVENEN